MKILQNQQLTRPKIFFLSYGVFGHDGRLSELLQTVLEIGCTHLVSLRLGELHQKEKYTHTALAIDSLKTRRSAKTQFKFIILAVREAWRNRRAEILFVDDLMSAPAALLILPIIKPKIVIQDTREFYFGRRDMRAGKIFFLAERFLFKRSDAIICANDERADIMKALYGLKHRPIVFENIRHLPKSSEVSRSNKGDSSTKLVSTGGCSIQRGTLNLISIFRLLNGVSLTIVGTGTPSDFNQVTSYIRENGICNVEIVDRIPYSELSEYLLNFDIGVVEYHQNDLNNIFCASGKVFEYAAAGLPIVCTPNISLQSVCRKYGIGEASHDMVTNIEKVIENLTDYRRRCLEFSKILSPEKNRETLKEEIKNLTRRKLK